MPTIAQLHELFDLDIQKVAGEEPTDGEVTEASVSPEEELAEALGLPKTAYINDPRSSDMKSLAEIYNHTVSLEKQAHVRVVENNDHLEKIAEQMAHEEIEMKKLASEYDAAGRIMARGFMDEFQKLALEVEEIMGDGTPAQVESDLKSGPADPTTGPGPKSENKIEDIGDEAGSLDKAKALVGAPGAVEGGKVMTVRDAFSAPA